MRIFSHVTLQKINEKTNSSVHLVLTSVSPAAKTGNRHRYSAKMIRNTLNYPASNFLYVILYLAFPTIRPEIFGAALIDEGSTK
jgi:hypothetical protein